MKTIKYIVVAIFMGACLLSAENSSAQFLRRNYLNADWQFNFPVSNDFVSKASGWGASFEGGRYIAPDLALGLFLAYHTNNEYFPRQTFQIGAQSSVTTDQQHSIYQLPFGAGVRYRLMSEGSLEPYIAFKVGANFARMNSFYSAFESYDNTWGFYMSPEIGVTIYPTMYRKFGIHIAGYFSYATNNSDLIQYSVNGLSNFGLRAGFAF